MALVLISDTMAKYLYLLGAECIKEGKEAVSWWTFMKEVFLTNQTTGAIAPSGRKLAEAVTDMAQLQGAKVVVEYGPGTGVFTEVIAEKIDPETDFIAMEINPEFVRVTRERCPRARVFEDSAQNTYKYLKEAGYEYCDVIVSGLPWTRFDDQLQDEILEATYKILRPGGRFVTFSYAFSPMMPSGGKFFKTKLPLRFPNTTVSKPMWQNIPPCLVFIAEK